MAAIRTLRNPSLILRGELRESGANEFSDRGRKHEVGGGVLRGGAEFAPSFFQNIDELFARVISVLRGEGADFVFEKDKDGRVFEGLGARVGFQSGFGNPGGNFGGFVCGDAGGEEQFAGAFGLFDVERATPSQVADFAFGKRGAGSEPALEMLAAGGEQQKRASVGHQTGDPGCDTFAVDEFGGATVDGARGIGGVCGVDKLAGAGVGFHADRNRNGCLPRGKRQVGSVMPLPPVCLRCGVCCFSKLETYVRVTGEDWTRLGAEAERLAHFVGHRAYMRMSDGHCAALLVRVGEDGARQYFCSVYETRPATCRELERGSPQCAGEIALKGERPGQAAFS